LPTFFHIPVSNLINPWSTTQDLNLYDQGSAGARYFDIRAAWQNNQWSIFHFNLGLPIKNVLPDIARFLNDHPSEIAIVEMSHFTGNANRAALEQLVGQIKSAFGSLLAPRATGFELTVNQIIASNQRAFVTFSDDATVNNEPFLFYGNLLYNTYADSNVANTMQSYNDQQVQMFNSQPLSGSIYKLSWTLTPQTSDIEGSLLPWNRNKRLFDLSDQVNPKLYQWGLNHLNQNRKIGGIILVDHLQTSQVVDLAIEANKH